MMRIDSSWSVLPQAPNIIVPRQRFETWTPVRPSVRSCMRSSLLAGGSRAMSVSRPGYSAGADDEETTVTNPAQAPLADSVLEALRAYDTPTICNAMEIVAPKRRLYGYTVKPLV